MPAVGTNILSNTSAGTLNVSSRNSSTTASCISVDSSSAACDTLTFNYTPTRTLSSAGSEEEFLPPYLTVYAWYRTA